MRLTFIGKDPDSNPTGSPTVYPTDRPSWAAQSARRQEGRRQLRSPLMFSPEVTCRRTSS
jgi:hypothetical protein